MAQIDTEEALRKIITPPNPLINAKLLDRLEPQAIEFISRSPFLLLATQRSDGSLEVSPKGDAPGFVVVENDRSLLIPDRVGNNMAIGLINLLANPQIGLLFLMPATGETLRVSGRATIHDDADICAKLATRNKPAKLFLRIAIQRVFFHCARSVLRANLWKPETWSSPQKVSVGKIVRDQVNARQNIQQDIAKRIDDYAEESYKIENLY